MQLDRPRPTSLMEQMFNEACMVLDSINRLTYESYPIDYQSLPVQTKERICTLIVNTLDFSSRHKAFMDLSRLLEAVEGLALLMWNTVGTSVMISVEIMNMASRLTSNQDPPSSAFLAYLHNLMRVIRVFTLQPEIQNDIVNLGVIEAICGLLHHCQDHSIHNDLKSICLAVIVALFKNRNQCVVKHLLDQDTLGWCLKEIRSSQNELDVVAASMFASLIFDDIGLNYVCRTYERIRHITNYLSASFCNMATIPRPKLYRIIIQIFLRISDNSTGRMALKSCLPECIRNGTLVEYFSEDSRLFQLTSLLLHNVQKATEVTNSSKGFANINLHSFIGFNDGNAANYKPSYPTRANRDISTKQ
ncbi:hypothetical protein ACOME3_000615 [Neoechinorhynchus agilis]